MKTAHLPVLAVGLLIAAIAAPVLAQNGAWGGSAWGRGGPAWNDGARDNGPREGKVSVDRFIAPDARPALNQPHNAVVVAPDSHDDPHDDAIFQAAVVDQLAKAGYDPTTPDPHGGLITQVHGGREIVVPQEPAHRPVSGEMAAGVSNRGSGFGLGLAIDLTKPRRALLDTRLEVRIVDRVSGKALWEGRADITTREGDRHWPDAAIAARLADALFAHFPGPKP